MFELIKSVLQNGYIDEHGHKLYGAAATAHFIYQPYSSINKRKIEEGKKFVQKYLFK